MYCSEPLAICFYLRYDVPIVSVVGGTRVVTLVSRTRVGKWEIVSMRLYYWVCTRVLMCELHILFLYFLCLLHPIILLFDVFGQLKKVGWWRNVSGVVSGPVVVEG